MKRWTLRITICLLLGVVTTVGVAWLTIALDKTISVSEIDSGAAYVRVKAEFGEEINWSDKWLDGSVGTRVSIGATLNWIFAGSAKQGFARYDVSRGLPFRALHGSVRYANGTTELTAAFSSPGAETEPWRITPLRPILPGFLINTLFYAAIWLGLFIGIGRTRRFIRTRRGRCPRCGYDLRGNRPHPQPLSQRERGDRGCPECGWGRDSTE